MRCCMRIKYEEVEEKIGRLRELADQLTMDSEVEFDRGRVRKSLQKAHEIAKSNPRTAAAICVKMYEHLLWLFGGASGERYDCSRPAV